MTRYVYYLMVVNMLVNVFAYVPSILIEHRFDGAIMSILLGTLIGSVLLLLFVGIFNRYPAQGLPELIGQSPFWLRAPVLFGFSWIWFAAGAMTLLAFNNVTIRYINPDISGIHMMFIYSVVVLVILAFLGSDKLLMLLEMILAINLPLVLLIMYHAYINKAITWPSIMEVLSYFPDPPNWRAVAGVTFTFSGYIGLLVFHRVINGKIPLRKLWALPVLGLVNLATTFLIPVGFHGADGVGDFTYPWVATADALRMDYAPIERLITVFLVLYISIALVSVILAWHVSFELLQSVFRLPGRSRKVWARARFAMLFTYGTVIIWMENQFRQEDIFAFGEAWLQIRFVAELMLACVLIWLAMRRRAST
ncbi:hypothetical protein IDH44_18030 [Paenibacillus sp. IB182496]|uniref:Spore germination protein n=1 Tax=Paenibacillus sabuli TaxID=2772509 RepID=A0A927BWC1_9BACL|nr:hypothetical protein [Paenibacillus sabuli]MBD2847101.1 hypothetical protein [Paenibacillus sabuli]